MMSLYAVPRWNQAQLAIDVIHVVDYPLYLPFRNHLLTRVQCPDWLAFP